jgi:methionyl-tRNA synthetase
VREVEQAAAATVDAFTARMDEFQIHLALEAVWGFVSRCDQLVETSAPWKLAKDPLHAGQASSPPPGRRVLAQLRTLAGRVSRCAS